MIEDGVMARPAEGASVAEARAAMRPLIHVGYLKCASTFLQDRLFYPKGLGFHRPGQDDWARLFEELILDDGFSFDATGARSRFDAAAAGGEGVTVWSEETLLGDPLQRRYNGGDVAERMQAVFPTARILIIIREQRAMALSCFRQYVREGGRHRIEDFIGNGREPMSFHPVLRPDFLRFSRAVGRYRELFGEDNVLVLPFETLVGDIPAGVGAIRTFACAIPVDDRAVTTEPSNPGLKGLALDGVRRLNPLRPLYPAMPRGAKRDRIIERFGRMASALPTGWHQPHERHLKTIVEQRYAGLFTEDNQHLQQMTGIDLASLGYML